MHAGTKRDRGLPTAADRATVGPMTRPSSSLLLLAPALLLGACAHGPAGPDNAAPPSPELRRAQATNGAVQLEYWVRAPAAERGAPVLLVPGMTGAADGWLAYAALVDGLVARGHRVIAVSLRGRGASTSPETGWTVADHAGDVAAVVAAERLERVHVVAHSAGVVYALRWALDAPARVASFTAGDFPPLLVQATEAWAAGVGGDVDGRKRYDRKLARRVLQEQGAPSSAFGDEPVVHDLRPALPGARFPVRVILGVHGQPEALIERHAGAWSAAPQHQVVRVDTGHDVFAHPDAVAAVRAVVDAAP